MKARHPVLHSRSAFAIAVFIFIFLISDHHPIHYLANFPYTKLQSLVILAPCVIFGLTVDAYYHFITRYRGQVSGLSLFFLLVALLCCVGLVEKLGVGELEKHRPGDWWEHLRYMYFLFFSFVVWDVMMIERLLKPSNCTSEDKELPENDKIEVKLVSYFINMPTLLTIFCVSFICRFCIDANGDTEEQIRTFVAGVVCFHLIFSSAAYIFVRLQAQDT